MVPPKIQCFVWRVLRNRLPTCDNLLKRKKFGEKILLMFSFGCIKVDQLRKSCYSWCGLLVVLPLHPSDHFSQHVIQSGSSIRNKRWQVVWSSLVWAYGTTGTISYLEEKLFAKRKLSIKHGITHGSGYKGDIGKRLLCFFCTTALEHRDLYFGGLWMKTRSCGRSIGDEVFLFIFLHG